MSEVINFDWFRDLLIKNFPDHMKDYIDVSERSSGLTPKGLLLQRLKDEAGEIPKNTCADIDRVIKGINDAIGSLHDLQRQCGKKNDAWDYSRDAERAIDDLEPILEKLRSENEQLRSLGKFWYEQFKKLLVETEDSILTPERKV